jgi:predicted site-specific integrase-resolvase
MSVSINGQTYYRTAEVCKLVGVSRTTLFRYLKGGVCDEPALRDRRGWRLFTMVDIDKLTAVVNRVDENSARSSVPRPPKQS